MHCCRCRRAPKWEIALPADNGYGADPRTGFPPNVAVVFEVKLDNVK